MSGNAYHVDIPGSRSERESLSYGILHSPPVFWGPMGEVPLNASKPSEHSPPGEKLSKYLGGNIGCRDKTLDGIKSVPRCSHIGSTL